MDVSMRRRVTKRSIQLNPATIRLERQGLSKGSAGGIDRAPSTTLPPQTMKLFPMGRAGVPGETPSEGGTVRLIRWGLLAEWDADVRRNDEFSYMGGRYRVQHVRNTTHRGEVVSLQCELEEVT